MPNTKRGSTKLEDRFVSVVILADRDTTKLSNVVKRIGALLRSRYHNYEVIVIDNFIPIKQLTHVTDLLTDIPCVRIVRLSRTVTKDTAAFAGLEAAIGDHVVLISPTSDPATLIPDFVNANKSSDIIFGISAKSMRGGFLNRYGAEVFYWYNKKYLGIEIPARSTYFMALNRRAVNALTRSGRNARHIRYLARQIGYGMAEIKYEPLKTAIPEKKSIRALVESAVELTTNYSLHPLRLISRLGAAAATVNLIYCLYIVGIRIFGSHVAEGWTTLSLQSAVMFFFIFLILAALSEYVGKILEETRNEVPYHVMDELNSKVSIADTTRRNITN